MRRFAFRLAIKLGRLNVDGMLRSVTAKQFQEWMYYAQLEPFGEIRDDYRTASIVAMLANINRDPKRHPEPYKLERFLLKFGEPALGPAKPQRKTWQQQKQFLLDWIRPARNTNRAKPPEAGADNAISLTGK